MKRLRIIGAIMIIATVAVLLLLPRSADMEKYESMYQRGYYAQVSRSLQKELKGRPQWHEARQLLIQAELKQNKLESAISHLLALEEGGLSSMLLQMKEWLEANKLSQDEAGRVLALLSQRLQAKSAAPEIYALFMQMVVEYQDPSLIPKSLKLVMEAPIEFSDEIESLFYSAMCRVYTAGGDIPSLLNLAVEYDSRFGSGIMMGMRAYVVLMLSADEVAFLRADYPGDALLAIKHALMLEPTVGLEFVREWERQYTVDESSASIYASMKLALLAGVEHLEPGDIAYMDFDQLMDLAMSCTFQPTKCQVILDYLDEHNYDPVMTQVARAAMKGPEPSLRLDGYVVSISPDGEKIICSDGGGASLHVGKSETKLADRGFPSFVYWSPDSSHFVMITETLQGALQGAVSYQGIGNNNGDGVLFSVADGVGKELGFSGAVYTVLGWKGPNTLWLQNQKLNNSKGPYYEYNIETEEIVPSQVAAPAWAESFHPSPEGYVAWSSFGRFSLYSEDEPHSLPGMFLSWLPDGSGLLLQDGAGLCLWTGGELEPTGVDGQFLGWRNDRVFYWMPRGRGFNISKLMGYDIKTGKVIDYNALGVWTVANGKTAAAWNAIYLRGIISSSSGLHPTQPTSFVYYIP